jgi:hypothetical protein
VIQDLSGKIERDIYIWISSDMKGNSIQIMLNPRDNHIEKQDQMHILNSGLKCDDPTIHIVKILRSIKHEFFYTMQA